MESTNVNIEILIRNIETLKKFIGKRQSLLTDIEKIRVIINKIKNDARLKREIQSKKLIEMGIDLIGNGDTCPLCLTEWPQGQLRYLLDQRLENAVEAIEQQKNIDIIASELKTKFESAKETIDNVKGVTKKLDLTNIFTELEQWQDRITAFIKVLNDPLNNEINNDEISLITENKLITSLDYIIEHYKAISIELTPEQKAWDTLTQLAPLLDNLNNYSRNMTEANHLLNRVNSLANTFETSREEVLGDLYKSVQNKFAELYSYIHDEDEKEFLAALEPRGAELVFEVDFFGRGKFPPAALHSEGHQDSMGLCLYLALNEKMAGKDFELIVLDDVVMSVDNSHRRRVCKLLHEKFPDKQFFLTTHEKGWARQLLTDGVVEKENLIEFKGWSVEAGPRIEYGKDLWAEIDKHLSEEDVVAAAGKLRNGMEAFFESVCDSLRGQICFRGDLRWELGDYLPSALNALKNNISKGKVSVQSWKNNETFKLLNNYTDSSLRLLATLSQNKRKSSYPE